MESGLKGIFMIKSSKVCEENFSSIYVIKFCQKVNGYVLKRLAKFEQNLWVGSCFTMSRSFSMKTSLCIKKTHMEYSLRSLDSDYAECEVVRFV